MKRVLLALGFLAIGIPHVYTQTASPQQQSARPQLGPNQWTVDASHSAANFSVRHMMVTTVRGQLGPIAGTVDYDGKDVRTVKADVKIDVNAITTQNPKRDGHLRSDDFFDAANHPFITFTSKRVEPGAAGSFKLIGDLSIRGTTKEVVLNVEGPTPPVKGMGGVRIGATATTKVNRLEYGLKWNSMIEAGPVVSDEVTITVDLELTRPGMPAGTQ
jgi:polyisoprenoid-binding protein YceI